MKIVKLTVICRSFDTIYDFNKKQEGVSGIVLMRVL